MVYSSRTFLLFVVFFFFISRRFFSGENGRTETKELEFLSKRRSKRGKSLIASFWLIGMNIQVYIYVYLYVCMYVDVCVFVCKAFRC